MSRVGYSIDKVFGGHILDGSLDFYDFIPLVVVLVAAVFILIGLFPNGFSGFSNIFNSGLGLNNGQLIIGRDGRRVLDIDDVTFDSIMNALEASIVSFNLIRKEAVAIDDPDSRGRRSQEQVGSCTSRLACNLGNWARTSTIVGEGFVNTLIPESYSGFSKAFMEVFRNQNRTHCDRTCTRCVEL